MEVDLAHRITKASVNAKAEGAMAVKWTRTLTMTCLASGRFDIWKIQNSSAASPVSLSSNATGQI